MSWSVSFDVSEKDITDDSEENVEKFIANADANGMLDEAKEQFIHALAGAIAMIETGAVGNPYGDYYVTISGHANPKHEPASGWANDSVMIIVAQKSRVEEKTE